MSLVVQLGQLAMGAGSWEARAGGFIVISVWVTIGISGCVFNELRSKLVEVENVRLESSDSPGSVPGSRVL